MSYTATSRDVGFIAVLLLAGLVTAQYALAADDWVLKNHDPEVMHCFGQRVDQSTDNLHWGIDTAAKAQNPTKDEADNLVQLPKNMKFWAAGGADENKYVELYDDSGATTHYFMFGHLRSYNAAFNTAKQGDSFNKGDTIGYIGNNATSPAPDHLHWAGGTVAWRPNGTTAAYVVALVNPLSYFDWANTTKDPQNVRPEFIDRTNPKSPWDSDGDIFQFMCNGSYLASTAKTAGGEWIVDANTDCVAELQDKMNYASRYPGAYKTAYWVDADKTNGGHDVKTSEAPYVLFEHSKMPGTNNGGTFDGKRDALYEVTQKEITYTWTYCFHYVLTNTKGTDGSVANLDKNQYWNTDAKDAGTNGGNGVGTNNDATKAKDAYFRDGKYIINAKAWDLIDVTDTTHAVYVENFPPAVASKWPAGGICGDGAAAVTDNVEITFSEPMNTTATVAAVTIKKKSDGSTVTFLASWNSGEYILTCDPTSDLEYDTEYEVTITTAAKDPYGGASFNGFPLDSEFDSANHNGTGGEGGDAVTWTFWTLSQ